MEFCLDTDPQGHCQGKSVEIVGQGPLISSSPIWIALSKLPQNELQHNTQFELILLDEDIKIEDSYLF